MLKRSSRLIPKQYKKGWVRVRVSMLAHTQVSISQQELATVISVTRNALDALLILELD